jgi:hypothetical protein
MATRSVIFTIVATGHERYCSDRAEHFRLALKTGHLRVADRRNAGWPTAIVLFDLSRPVNGQTAGRPRANSTPEITIIGRSFDECRANSQVAVITFWPIAADEQANIPAKSDRLGGPGITIVHRQLYERRGCVRPPRAAALPIWRPSIRRPRPRPPSLSPDDRTQTILCALCEGVMTVEPVNEIRLVTIDVQHYVSVIMDGCTLQRRGPYSVDMAEAMAIQFAAICGVLNRPIEICRG